MSVKSSHDVEQLQIEDKLIIGEPVYKIVLYKRRFINLFLFCLCTIMNACGWICFAPISSLLISVRNPNSYIGYRFME